MWVFGSNFVKLYLLILACSRQVQPFSLSSDAIGNFRESFVLSMSSTEKSRSDSRSKEYRSLKPLPCLGSYEQDMGTKYSSMFLGFEKMVVQERADGKCVCKGTPMSENGHTQLRLPLDAVNVTDLVCCAFDKRCSCSNSQYMTYSIYRYCSSSYQRRDGTCYSSSNENQYGHPEQLIQELVRTNNHRQVTATQSNWEHRDIKTNNFEPRMFSSIFVFKHII
jgi:hypothetical protein